MTIPTVSSLRRTARRLDREQQRRERMQQLANDATERMRDRDYTLHLTNRPRTQIWWLGAGHADGFELPPEAATILLSDPHVIAADGGGLFGDAPQLWRWCDVD